MTAAEERAVTRHDNTIAALRLVALGLSETVSERRAGHLSTEEARDLAVEIGAVAARARAAIGGAS